MRCQSAAGAKGRKLEIRAQLLRRCSTPGYLQLAQTSAHLRMIDDVDSEPPVSDLPNPARVYRDYLVTCRRMGVTPTSPDRAKVLLKEWPTRSPLPRRGRLRSRIASSVPKAATSKAFAVAAALTYRTDLSDSNPSAARRSHVARLSTPP